MPSASCKSDLSAYASIFLRKTVGSAQRLDLMRELQLSLPCLKNTKLRFGFLDRASAMLGVLNVVLRRCAVCGRREICPHCKRYMPLVIGKQYNMLRTKCQAGAV